MTRGILYLAISDFVSESEVAFVNKLSRGEVENLSIELTDKLWKKLKEHTESVEGLFNPEEEDDTMVVLIQEMQTYNVLVEQTDCYKKTYEVEAVSKEDAIAQMETEVGTISPSEDKDTFDSADYSVNIINE